jgi:integrase
VQNIKNALDKANLRLKNGAIGIAIEQKGNRLVLRGWFPPKPRSEYHESYQQRISLGILPTIEGIDFLEQKAKEWGGLLAQKRWDWRLVHEDIHDIEAGINVVDAIAKFEEDYFLRREKNDQTLTTWNSDYVQPFKKLDQGILSTQLIMKAVALTKPNTKSRKRGCIAYGALCKFHKIEIDLSRYSGDYSSLKVQPRDLPTDSQILEAYKLIPNKAWKFIFGLMTVYGVRNHEAFRCDFSKMPVLIVLKGKSGYREIYPLYPEWIDLFKLDKIEIPKVDLTLANGRLGTKVSHQFARYKIPFAPYNLRHAWAIRAISFGIPDSIAAAQMGHSLTVHNRTYQKWLTAANHKQVFDSVMARSDRPLPPQI